MAHLPNLELQTHLQLTLRQSQNTLSSLLTSHRFPELSLLLQSMQSQVKDYYKLPVGFSNLQTIRTLNKLRKREQITLLHNQAVLSAKQKHTDRTIDIRSVIVDELSSMVQAEQTRFGFLDDNDHKQKKASMQSITYWKYQLIRHYFLLATVTSTSSLEVSLAALMKGLDLIKLSFHSCLNQAKSNLDKAKSTHDESYSEQLCHFQQMEQMLLLCQLREKVAHSKYLNIVSVNALIESISILAKEDRATTAAPQQFHLFYEEMTDLELPDLSTVISGEYDGCLQVNELQFNKVALFLYLGLLANLYSGQDKQTESQYQKLKNVKNTILIHLLQAVIANHYLPNYIPIDHLFQQFRTLYKPKPGHHHHKQASTIYTLIQMFGLTPEGLSQPNHPHDDISIIEANHHHKCIQNIKKVKQNSKPKSHSQPKSKSKSKPKQTNKVVVKKSIPEKAINKKIQQQKQKKHRVREEYMLKKQGKNEKGGSDYLSKAINQNYRSFDSSRSKEKHNSPFRRVMRTQTCINDRKIKIQVPPLAKNNINRHKKMH